MTVPFAEIASAFGGVLTMTHVLADRSAWRTAALRAAAKTVSARMVSAALRIPVCGAAVTIRIVSLDSAVSRMSAVSPARRMRVAAMGVSVKRDYARKAVATMRVVVTMPAAKIVNA